MFVYGGWDGTLYVNEEVKHRRINPGRAAIIAVALLAVIYTLAQVGFQGVVSPGKLQAHSANALVYVAQALGGSIWARAMALAIALSVIATTGTGIVLSARIAYGMASYRALPGFLSQRVAQVLRRRRSPARRRRAPDRVFWVYMLATTIQNAFYDVIDTTGLLFAIFYVLTALASDRLLPSARVQRSLGLHHARPAAARCGWLPRLDVRARLSTGCGGRRRTGRSSASSRWDWS